MAKLESWTSIGALAMGSLFVSLMISFYAFLIGPDGKGPNVDVDPGALLGQTISISGAPSLILVGIALGLSFRSRNVFAGSILILTGLAFIVGMWVTDSMIRDIDVQYKTTGLEYAPKIFLVAGIGVLSLGAYLAKIAPQSKVRRARDYER
ncbi:MAG TPA: hypothetical protein VE130_04095 [Nitrososphaeraceae archaeon]|nr:hypothetical protein [Nitrososphaeraceae archaeon]